MGSLIDIVFSNPVYLAIAVILTILLVYALIKKVIKLIFTIGVVLVIYVIYLNYTGQEVPKNMDDVVGKAKDLTSKVGSSVKSSTKSAKDGIKNLNPFKK